MKKLLFFLVLALMSGLLSAQIVSLQPTSVGPEDSVILTFDASLGNAELVGASKVYIHHGVVTDVPNGTTWEYVIGNWGQDDGVGEMQPVPGQPDKWQISIAPSIRNHFGVPAGTNIFRISCVFRSADGNTKGSIAPGNYGWGTVASNGDYFIDLNVDNFISINEPTGGSTFLSPGGQLNIAATASDSVSDMQIYLDEGSGYTSVAQVSSGTSIGYAYLPSQTVELKIKVTAVVRGDSLEAENVHDVIVIQPTVTAALPTGLQLGINYDTTDATRATLVLEAPGKAYSYVVGDFTDWKVRDSMQMKVTPDGELFWLEVTNLTPRQQYVYQYWVDGDVKIGDPYAELVVDPWNDRFIDSTTYPNMPVFTRTDYSLATVLQTDQQEYQWASSEDNWQRPNEDHLVIYELLIRDFTDGHVYDELIDSLDYIKSLGVNVIGLMPNNEFEGNESWGYNPSYYFAPDKYYGPEDEFKRFVEAAHQKGIAVIMDLVLNHAFGQNAMVRLYWNQAQNRPAADNPWFNETHVGPFDWGFDFDHESDYTKRFIDRVNAHWIDKYHVDGYRFDFTKGFTNYAPGGNIDGYDQSRIDILKRMADKIWEVDSSAYVILEHWGGTSEENELGNYGMKMWRNRSYDFVPAVTGAGGGNFNNMDAPIHVSYFNSHDERRMAEHALTEGRSNGTYSVKDPLVMYERMKLAAAFCYLFPGPKMMWMFDELGYDIDINFRGRTGNKPLPWGPNGLGYYEDSLRQHILKAYQGIMQVRNHFTPEALANATKNHRLFGEARRLTYDLPGDNDMILIGNFGLETEFIQPQFTRTGIWYDYFFGDSIFVNDVANYYELAPGEWHILTSQRISDGMPGVVEVYDNPVTVTPYPFTKEDQITITFDASKAWPNGTAGLIAASKVYMHAGVVLNHPDSTRLQNVVGTLTDDGVGQMTDLGNGMWEITLRPSTYFGVTGNTEIYKIGMFFRDADNTNQGYGFRNSMIYVDVASSEPILTVDPPNFSINDQVTLTFNARAGNREMVGASKVYWHGGVDLTPSQTPWSSGWQNVVGNWGQDDGVGELQRVPGQPDKWFMTFVPKDYFGLGDDDFVHWICAVMRSPDGNTKGTGTPGPIENGIIHSNLDMFIRNQRNASAEEDFNGLQVRVFPNPASEQVFVELEQQDQALELRLLDMQGRMVQRRSLTAQPGGISRQVLNISSLPAGIYLLNLQGEGVSFQHKVIKP
jgi:hypothetical protein